MAKETKKEVKTEVTPEVTEGETPKAPELAIQDLALLRSCIELGSSRGAWRANELTAVGTVYEKLTAFLQAVMPPVEKADDEADADAEANTADKGETKND